ncbi:hypothetical protein [Rathayibacter sp. AY1D3]|uniref:hypothetical protein n=1 Tax=Rathayibacter sp. AY1D3 TaxID=2080544 RepID=UPI000CE877AE|nr:hypothetical protein [Rathayibacter sp. AY1D3]PPH85286.1 hypothetical protein C5C64_16650 [Rathayibacter sp. AY1D3]
MNHDLTTTVLKSLDSAPSSGPTDISKRRAEAGLQQILATDVETSTNGSRVRTRRSRASWIALPFAAAAVAAGVTVVSGVATPDPAYASWTPEPTPLNAVEQKIAGDACIDPWRQEDLQSPQLVLAERRGEWVGVVYADAYPAVTTCLMYFPEGSDRVRNVHAGRSGGQGAIPVDGEFTDGSMSQFTETGLFGIGAYPTVSFNVGDVGPDVEAVTITSADGEEVDATVENGRFVAWWPGRVFGSDGSGQTGYGGPEPDLAYRITLRDGTVVNDAQTIRPE